jgi:hypothetical protein
MWNSLECSRQLPTLWRSWSKGWNGTHANCGTTMTGRLSDRPCSRQESIPDERSWSTGSSRSRLMHHPDAAALSTQIGNGSPSLLAKTHLRDAWRRCGRGVLATNPRPETDMGLLLTHHCEWLRRKLLAVSPRNTRLIAAFPQVDGLSVCTASTSVRREKPQTGTPQTSMRYS